MDTPKTILFYDIASGPPVTCYAPNPWKTRYALNFKGLHYQTQWIELPDVASVRKKLGAPPNRTFWDGNQFYTLPIIQDLSNGEIVGDSFDIALYLEKTYPDTPTLFPPSTIALQAAFNKQADAIFTPFSSLCVDGIPFNPETAEESKLSFVYRAQKEKWEDFNLPLDKRTEILKEFEVALGELAKHYRFTEGLFLGGETPLYADLIVGAWLQFFRVTMKEWEELQTWHDGLYGKIHRALQKYAEVK